MSPGIVSAESSLCATIHWGSSFVCSICGALASASGEDSMGILFQILQIINNRWILQIINNKWILQIINNKIVLQIINNKWIWDKSINEQWIDR